MNEDKNLAAPKWMGLNADEKILCEFELVHTVHKEVRAALCLLTLLLYAGDKGFDVGIFWVAMTAGCAFLFCLFARQSVKTAKAKKLYVTNKRFITERGDTVGIGDVYFKYFDSGYSWVSFKVELCFYENKKFLFYCVVDEESDEYKNLINSLYEISKNDRLLQKHLGYYVKQKLINP